VELNGQEYKPSSELASDSNSRFQPTPSSRSPFPSPRGLRTRSKKADIPAEEDAIPVKENTTLPGARDSLPERHPDDACFACCHSGDVYVPSASTQKDENYAHFDFATTPVVPRCRCYQKAMQHALMIFDGKIERSNGMPRRTTIARWTRPQ
jgi:hypothetical protein